MHIIAVAPIFPEPFPHFFTPPPPSCFCLSFVSPWWWFGVRVGFAHDVGVALYRQGGSFLRHGGKRQVRGAFARSAMSRSTERLAGTGRGMSRRSGAVLLEKGSWGGGGGRGKERLTVVDGGTGDFFFCCYCCYCWWWWWW